MLLSRAKRRLYIIELTVDFETNLDNNARRKEIKYSPLLTDLGNDYQKIEFINLTMSCLGIFGHSSGSFVKMCTKLGFDNHHISFIISKLSTIIIRTTYYILLWETNHGATPSFSVIDYVNSCYKQLLLYIIYSMYLSFILFLLTSIVSQPNTDYLLAKFVD